MKKLSFLFAALVAGVSFISFGETVDPSAFDKKIGYTISGYTGLTTITDLPVLVRLKDDVPSGFAYADCPQDSIRFADGEGNLIPHEVDTWDASGESLIWVKIPSVSGQETSFVMFYGSDRSKPSALSPSAVWANYRGVWHLNEAGADGGTADPIVIANATSAGADLNGEAYGGTVGVDGKIGGGRRISDSTDTKNAVGGIWVDGSKDCADVGSKLTISGWMIHRNQAYYYDHIFYRREASNSSNGGIAIEINNTANKADVRGNGNTTAGINIPAAVKTDWTYLSFVYDEKTATIYANGEKTGNGSVGAATDNNLRWVFGNDTDGYKGATGDISWKGSMDEIRLSAVAQTADYAKAEYQAMGEDFLTASEAKSLDPAMPELGTLAATVDGAGNAIVTITVTAGEGKVYVIYNGDEANKKLVGAIDPAAEYPQTFTDMTKVFFGESVPFAAYVVNEEKGYEARKAGSAPMVKPLVALDFAKRIDFSLSDEAETALGEMSAADVPVAVRLSAAITGFSYADFNLDHTDIAFGIEDENGFITLCPYEVESWNEEGESVIWVKVPTFASSSAFSMFYGNAILPNDPTKVWGDYVGVWHMAENGGEAADATGHGLTGVPTKGSSGTQAMLDAMVATDGVIGKGRVNQLKTGASTVGIKVPNYNAHIADQAKFTLSGWFYSLDKSGYPRPFSRKSAYDNSTGWEVQMENNSDVNGSVRGSSGTGVAFTTPSTVANWNHFAFIFKDTSLTPCINGTVQTSGTIAKVVTRTDPMCIGNNFAISERGWCGYYDEIRLYNGVQSADRAKAEYLAMLPETLVASDAQTIDAVAPKFSSPEIVVDAEGEITMTFTVLDGQGTVSAVCGGVRTSIGTIGTEVVLNEPVTVPLTIAEGACVLAGAYGVAPTGTEVTKLTSSGVMNAAVTVTKIQDAKENGLVKGVLMVSRPDTATAYPLVVNLAWSGTAEAGKDFADNLPTAVKIPAGETAVTIEVTPIINIDKDEDTTLACTVLAGSYVAGGTATLTIENLRFDPNYNTWTGRGADNKASNAANWSQGAPAEGQQILFDQRFANAENLNCEWDKDAPHTLAAWKQAENFTGTVTVDTTFDTYSADFTNLVITGDVTINGGTLQQKTHGTGTSTQYRLMMTVGGDFTIGSAGTVSVAKLGRYSNQTWGGSAAHGGDNVSGTTAQYNANDPAYGDILAPMAVAHGSQSGTDSNDKKSHGGGALYLVVAGDFTNAGVVTADGEASYSACGAGGSIYITAANIYGAGKYTSSVPAMGKTDGTGAVGSGGRIALVATRINEAANISCTGRCEGWGRRGAAGTVYLKGEAVNEIRVKNSEQESWNMIQTTTPIPAEDDTMNWKTCAKGIDLVGDWCAHLRLTQPVVKMNSLSLLSEASNRKNGNTVYYRQSDLDLAGKVLQVRSVIVDGVDLKLPAGDYTLADAETLGWAWLKDSSHKAAVEDNPDTSDVDESAAEVPGTGILRVVRGGMVILIK